MATQRLLTSLVDNTRSGSGDEPRLGSRVRAGGDPKLRAQLAKFWAELVTVVLAVLLGLLTMGDAP